MADVQEYKCPNCGGKLTFDSGTQNMKCPYCDSEIDVAALAEYDKGLEEFSAQDKIDWETPGKVWQEGDSEGLRVYVCNSCGGQIIGDANLGATSCPYCGNPVVLMGQFSGDLKPDYVIPFKLDKKAAKEAYLKHLEKKPLLPKAFKDKNHIDEIKGLYVPFWMFDASAEGAVQFLGTQIRSWTDRKMHYTETRYYDVYRAGNMSFTKVPVDGSSTMPNDLMESIEPFDYSEAVDFQTAFLSGYFADRYDEDQEETLERAKERIQKTATSALESTVSGYSSLEVKNFSVNVKKGGAKYALLPVWILSTTYNGEKYLFCMNAQTGKMVGNLPSDKGAVWKYRLLWTGISAAIIFVLLFLFMR